MDFKLMENIQLTQVLDYTQNQDGDIHIAIKDGLKKCSSCTYIKPLNKFHNNFSSKDGVQYYCKECSKAENKKARNFKLFQQMSQDYHNGLGMFQ